MGGEITIAAQAKEWEPNFNYIINLGNWGLSCNDSDTGELIGLRPYGLYHEHHGAGHIPFKLIPRSAAECDMILSSDTITLHSSTICLEPSDIIEVGDSYNEMGIYAARY
jgi:hypothetical protein